MEDARPYSPRLARPMVWVAIGGLALSSLPQNAIAADCAFNEADMMALSVEIFDATLGKGWRPLGDIEGCESVTAGLISRYRSGHPDIPGKDRRQLFWHEAQLRAASDQSAEAVQLFSQARQPPESSTEENSLYLDATIAFLQHDRGRLLDVRQKYIALPMDEGFAQAAAEYKRRTGVVLVWPVNLAVIDGFVACFDKPYRIAYSFACRPKP